ncbi:hypothetical protein GCM10023084_40990 [Streptomyces lacrimifluminis]|uniref:DUF397 domain-containing protein n=1 Tax=Streptomyces lacrimifluminis TaxID=1500077 RepID=A0A917L271_9ACTN|nr:DUF397 domain-containing protein [Streptomyces lacrimifluminis]GGJ41231.1 hypothetical protein GCM10012282_42620 [Streptomyces lacrimifluminis]
MPTNAPKLAPEHAWFKSSYSDPGQNCVEATHFLAAPGIALRDSKNPTGPALHLTPTAWTAFVTHLCEGPVTRA